MIAAFEIDIKVAFAGPLARVTRFPDDPPLDPQEDDIQDAQRWATAIALLLAGQSPFEPANVSDPAIIAVANQRLARLQRNAEALVADYWPAIERVAEALITRDLMEEAELDRLIAARKK